MSEITRVKPQLSEEDTADVNNEFGVTKSSRVTKEVELPVKSGWARHQRPRSTGSQQINRLTVPNDGEETLIKFLDEVPFAAYYVHWIMTDSGRRPYTCAGFEDCPLCARGDRAKSQDMINVVSMTADNVETVVWQMSSDPATAVEERASGKRTAPLNRSGLYFAVSKKKGTNGFFSYTLDPVREEDLQEDWGITPLTDAQFKDYASKKYDSSIVRIHTISELQQAAVNLNTD